MMPVLRRAQLEGFENGRRAWTVPLAILIALAAAGVIGWAIGRGSATNPTSRTVTGTVTIAALPPTVYQHTPQGAVAAAEANLVQAETGCLQGYERCQSPDAYSLRPDGGGVWSLAYRIKSYTPTSAVVEAWQLGIASGGPGTSRLGWGLVDVPVSWTGHSWRQLGQVTQLATGPTPPPDQSAGTASQSFARSIASFWRFPGAP
jgi:hypothetical protein